MKPYVKYPLIAAGLAALGFGGWKAYNFYMPAAPPTPPTPDPNPNLEPVIPPVSPKEDKEKPLPPKPQPQPQPQPGEPKEYSSDGRDDENSQYVRGHKIYAQTDNRENVIISIK